MCGICAVLGFKGELAQKRKQVVELSTRQIHRGPDWRGLYTCDDVILSHERLSINGVLSGAQPIVSKDETVVLTVNGEIYNHKQLEKEHLGDIDLKTGSDCECLVYLAGPEFLNYLNGDFAFVLYDKVKKTFLAARDPAGVCPLYMGTTPSGETWFASEMKSLSEECDKVILFPPGSYYTPETGLVRWYQPPWWDPSVVPTAAPDLVRLRASFERAVYRRMMAEVPYGVLLSGGLDSSLVAAVAARKYREIKYGAPMMSFSIGIEGQSPDLIAAQKVADFIGTEHYGFTFTVEDGLDALQKLVWHLETYDITTIRASTPMFLLSRKIKAMGVKMVLSGEGSDEILGGYLYFHNAPSKEAFHKETVDRFKELHTSDCLRANKSTAAWGLEVRVPFLDVDFLNEAFSFDPAEKMFPGEDKRMEKYVIRKAFDDPDDPLLPDEILWRQKEQFSDGVGFVWIDSLIKQAEELVSDEEFAARAERFPVDTPWTKEGYFYRDIFEKKFASSVHASTVKSWVPTWGKSKDPSGRAQTYHANHDQSK